MHEMTIEEQTHRHRPVTLAVSEVAETPAAIGDMAAPPLCLSLVRACFTTCANGR
jgi:hypothetical protein